MFQEFHDEYEQHPDILDRAAITGPRRETWNWRLTVLVAFLFGLACWFLYHSYHDLTSTAIRYAVQVRVTWMALGLGMIALASAFLLRRRNQLGWVSTTILVTFLAVLFMVIFGQTLLRLAPGQSSTGMLYSQAFLEMAWLPVNIFLFYLVSSKTVRGIFNIPDNWLKLCLAMGGILGAVGGGWLIL
jgi:hypothetical protein